MDNPTAAAYEQAIASAAVSTATPPPAITDADLPVTGTISTDEPLIEPDDDATIVGLDWNALIKFALIAGVIVVVAGLVFGKGRK
jgi:hypothetical protein